MSDNSKTMPVTILLFRNCSHEIGDLLFSKLCRHIRRRPNLQPHFPALITHPSTVVRQTEKYLILDPLRIQIPPLAVVH